LRLWSIHPSYLDWKGLGANWRESLLAQAVLLGRTKGWRNHPQLERFRRHPEPVAAIGFYLLKVQEEATKRGYRYDQSKIVEPREDVSRVEITSGQLRYEIEVLKVRLSDRAPEKHAQLIEWEREPFFPRSHPMFWVVYGDIEPWETGYWSRFKKRDE
jgi:hypothetical protein